MPEIRLAIDDVTAGYKPGFPILHGVSAEIGAGEIVTLIGPNGAGKSTLVKAIAGFVHVESGSITLDGATITGISPDRMADHGVAYVPQTDNIFRTLSVEQNLVLAAQRITGDRAGAVTKMFGLFPPLAEFRSLRAGGLSGGQRQMLAIAMALIAAPRLVLMDEPTAGLSPKVAQDVLKLIRDIASNDVSVLLVEQNAKAALRISDRAYVLAEGRNQHEGTGAALLDDPLIGEIYLGAWRRESA
jgi:ABC-type branched-subunit amino acid transport system ATPase component